LTFVNGVSKASNDLCKRSSIEWSRLIEIEVVINLGKEQSDNSAKINQIMQDNPDLSYEFVRQLLIAKYEVEAGRVEPYKSG